MWWIYTLLDLIALKWINFMPQVQPAMRLNTYCQHEHAECTRMNITHKHGWLHRADTEHSHGAHPTSICVGWRYHSGGKKCIFIYMYIYTCTTWHDLWGCSLTAGALQSLLSHRHTHVHITKAATGFHSLSSLQSLPQMHMEFLTHGLTVTAGTQTPVNTHSVRGPSLKEILKDRTSWAGQVQLWPEKHTKEKIAPDWPLCLFLSSHLFLPKLSRCFLSPFLTCPLNVPEQILKLTSLASHGMSHTLRHIPPPQLG